MSPNTVLRRRRHHQKRGGYDSDVEVLERGSEVPSTARRCRRPASQQAGRMQVLEDGRVVEDRLIGQEVSIATPQNSSERLNLMNPAVARTAEGGQGSRAGGPIDGIDVPVPLTPLVTTSRGNHPDVERVAGEPRSYAPLFSQQQLHRTFLDQARRGHQCHQGRIPLEGPRRKDQRPGLATERGGALSPSRSS